MSRVISEKFFKDANEVAVKHFFKGVGYIGLTLIFGGKAIQQLSKFGYCNGVTYTCDFINKQFVDITIEES